MRCGVEEVRWCGIDEVWLDRVGWIKWGRMGRVGVVN